MPRIDLTGTHPSIQDSGNVLELVLWTTKGSVDRAQKIPGLSCTFYRGHHGLKATVRVGLEGDHRFNLSLTRVSQRETGTPVTRKVVQVSRIFGGDSLLVEGIFGEGSCLRIQKEEESIDSHLAMWR